MMTNLEFMERVGDALVAHSDTTTVPTRDLEELVSFTQELGALLGILWEDRNAMIDHQWGLAVARWDTWTGS